MNRGEKCQRDDLLVITANVPGHPHLHRVGFVRNAHPDGGEVRNARVFAWLEEPMWTKLKPLSVAKKRRL
jgi:hypothetical protein